MQEISERTFEDSDLKQIEISQEVHKALKLEAADRDMPLKVLANDILEGWLESNRPEWNQKKSSDSEEVEISE